MSKTRSNVKGALVSEDCFAASVVRMGRADFTGNDAYLDLAGVLARELNDWLTSICDFDFVLRSKSGDNWKESQHGEEQDRRVYEPLMLLPPPLLPAAELEFMISLGRDKSVGCYSRHLLSRIELIVNRARRGASVCESKSRRRGSHAGDSSGDFRCGQGHG